MSKPAETETQRACREWWTARLGATTVAWGRDKNGVFLSEFARNAEAAWITSTDQLRRQLAESEAEIAKLRDRTYRDTLAYSKGRSAKCARLTKRAELAESKLALAEQDARRYRWLRDSARSPAQFQLWVVMGTIPTGLVQWAGEMLDYHIDAELGAAIAAGEVK